MTLLFILVAAGAGVQVLRWVGARAEGVVERFCYGAGIGLGASAYAVLSLGLAGQLTAARILWLSAVLLLLGGVQICLMARDGAREFGRWLRGPWDAARMAGLGLLLYCLALAFYTLIAALAPPNELDWDGLSYHLAAPKLYLLRHRIAFIPYDSHTNFPFTMEMLYTMGLWWGKAPAAKLFHWAAGWLTALALAAWTRRHLCGGGVQPERTREWAPLLAAALWMSIPVAAWEAGTAYIDLGTALFQFLALAALTRALDPDSGKELRLDWRWTLVSGLMTGWALGTKTTALLQFAVLSAFLLLACFRTRPRAAWGPAVAFIAAALLVGSPWYVKSYLWTNNPVYPFFSSLFPRTINWTPQFEAAYRHEQQSFGRPDHSLLDFLRAPWDLAFDGRDFFITAQRRLQWDKWGSLSPLAVGFGPLLLYCRRLNRWVLPFVAYALTSGVVWWFLSQQSRYLLPVFAPLAAAAVGVILAHPPGMLRSGALGLAVVNLAVGLTFARQMAEAPTEFVAGRATQDAYMRLIMPDLYPAANFVNRLPADSRIALYQESRGYYFDREYMWANPGQHDLIPYDRLRDGGALVDFLRDHFRITHVLINLDFAHPRDVEHARWWQLLREAITMRRLVPVYETREDGLQRGSGVVVLEAR